EHPEPPRHPGAPASRHRGHTPPHPPRELNPRPRRRPGEWCRGLAMEHDLLLGVVGVGVRPTLSTDLGYRAWVPADYAKIREENIARYGWDTAVLDLLGQLYSERTHFIFELIQNAEDAGATELAFELFDDRLELRHDGRPFTEADVRGVCGVGPSGAGPSRAGVGG